MSVTQANPFVLTGQSEYPDPANEGQFLVDPNATATWQEDSGGVACTLSGQVDNAGVSSIVVTPATDLQTDTEVNITGYGTDADGHATPISDPYTFTVPAQVVVPPSTDATLFVITGAEPVSQAAPAAGAADAGGSAEVPPITPGVPPTVEQINAAEAAAAAEAAPEG